MVVLQESLKTTSGDLVWETERGKKNKVYRQGTPLFRGRLHMTSSPFTTVSKAWRGIMVRIHAINRNSAQIRQHRNKRSSPAHAAVKNSQKTSGIVERTVTPVDLETWLPVLSRLSKSWLQTCAISWANIFIADPTKHAKQAYVKHAYIKEMKPVIKRLLLLGNREEALDRYCS